MLARLKPWSWWWVQRRKIKVANASQTGGRGAESLIDPGKRPANMEKINFLTDKSSVRSERKLTELFTDSLASFRINKTVRHLQASFVVLDYSPETRAFFGYTSKLPKQIYYRKTPQISTPPKISTPSFFPQICCRLQYSENTYPPNISTPVSWKYVHNRWNMQQQRVSTESTRLNRPLPCWIFHSALSYPPKVSTAPENKYLHHRLSRKYIRTY